MHVTMADLGLEWYIDLLSRLHINTFRYSKLLLNLLATAASPCFDNATCQISGYHAQVYGCMVNVAALHVSLCIPALDTAKCLKV